MADETAQWLEVCGLGHLAQVFADNGIGLDILPRLSEADLKDLGLNFFSKTRWRRTFMLVHGYYKN